MGQGDRSRTNRPKEAAVSDEVKKKALLAFWVKRWKKAKEIVVFSSTAEATSAQLPTLLTMSELGRRLTGVSVHHYGMGCFGAKSYKDGEIFSFCGGGAMFLDEAIGHYTVLGIGGLTPDARQKYKRMIVKILKQISPGGWNEMKRLEEEREALAFEEAQNMSVKEATVAWNKAGEDNEKRDKAQRELLRAAREVLKDMNAIGAHDEPSVVRLQKAVSNKALKS